MENQFELFLETVDTQYKLFVTELNNCLLSQDCKCDIKLAKSGYVVTYNHPITNKALATFVSRKSGMKLRIYTEHLTQYESLLNNLPDKLKKEIKKASVCKRLIDPTACNSKCPMGYQFTLDGEPYKKCRYMAFMLPLSTENNPHIETLLQTELSCPQ